MTTPKTGLQRAAMALYLPLMAALTVLVGLCLALLLRREKAGAYAFLYGAVLAILWARWRAIWAGRREPSLLLDVVLIGLADLLLVFYFL